MSPRTAKIDTTLNGASADYLFQEKASKEMLEINLRREGPLFEGDEDLLWEYKDFAPFSLETVSLAKLTNRKWALKGSQSFKASLDAFEKLQKAYLEYVALRSKSAIYLDPNAGQTESLFPVYNFLMLSMSATHGLRPHNRKYFFDPMKNMFEPVYYDGDIQFNTEPLFVSAFDLKYIPGSIKMSEIDRIKSKLNELKANENFIRQFCLLSKISMEKGIVFISRSIGQMLTKIEILEKAKSEQGHVEAPTHSFETLSKQYFENIQKTGLNQKTFELSRSREPGQFTLKCVNNEDCQSTTGSVEEIARLMSRNEFQKQRSLIFSVDMDLADDFVTIQTEIGEIIHSPGAAIEIDLDDKKLILSQKHSDDWFYIYNTSLEGWHIELQGVAWNTD